MYNWYSIYTKVKKENDTVFSLEKGGIKAFNPLCQMKKYVRGRKLEVIEPLFPCYIFAYFDYEENFRMVRYTRGVRKIVGNEGKPWPVSENIICLIKERMTDGIVKIQPSSFAAGDAVLIKNGPFEGIKGIFEKEIKGKDRVLIFLKTLEYQAKIEVDKFLVEKVAV